MIFVNPDPDAITSAEIIGTSWLADQVRKYVEFSDLVQCKDVVLCESVPRGMRSGVVDRGHLMPSRDGGIQHFQKLVHRFVSRVVPVD